MSQTVYNTPADQSNQNNNMIWMIALGLAAVIFFLVVVYSNGDNSGNEMSPTQIPQSPQSTQVPQEPQSTQVPQEPQSTQVPQPTTVEATAAPTIAVQL
jgi:YbbR domain-containing protein